MQYDQPRAVVFTLTVDIKAGARRVHEIDALVRSDKVVFMVVPEECRYHIARIAHCGKLPGGNVRRAGRLAEMTGGKAVAHFIIVSRMAGKTLDNALGLFLRGGDFRQQIVNLGNDDVLEEIGGEHFAVLLFERRGGRGVPVDLILLDAGVLGNALLAIRPAVQKPEIAHRAAAVRRPDEKIVVPAAGDIVRPGGHETAGIALIDGKLRLLAHAALVIVVAEHSGKRNAALGHGSENGVERLFHRRLSAYRGAVHLIAGEYDEIGVGSVELRIEQTERGLLRRGGVLRVGNDKDTEFPVFVKLQHGILLRGGDRRGKSRQQQRRERRAKERSDFIHDEPSG